MSASPETPVSDLPVPLESPPPGRAALRPLALRLHFYAGVLVAPFLVVACLTGLAYVFSRLLPLFGLSLLAFVLLDAAAATRRRPSPTGTEES